MSDRSTPAADDPRWHGIPVAAQGSSGDSEAWLAVERREGETAPPGFERLSPLATHAGLVLERHRLAREVRRAREDAEEARGVLGHALRGHLHVALLQADNVLLDLRKNGAPELADIREQLEALRDTVLDMEEGIRTVLEAPDAQGDGSRRRADRSREEIQVPELLRKVADREGAGDDPPRVEVEGEVPAIRADSSQLEPALGELFELARRSQSRPTLSVRRDEASPGVRIDLSVELPPFTGSDEGPGGSEGDAGLSPEDASPGGPTGSGRGELRPSLRETVIRLGGHLRVEAGEGGRARVVVILPVGHDG